MKNISESLELLRNGKITALELVNEHINRIEKDDDSIGAMIDTCFDEARETAKKLDKSGDFSAPLAGIPYTLKDVISVEGLKNTAGSKILEDFIPPFSAPIYERLKEAGAILLGKVNTDEFTMGSSCENSAIKKTKNPWDLTRVPGGSSGGSAAAVAKKFGLFSIGTDTGGSIRQPANFCGITGLKVSYGRVPRYGIISYASSFDSIGPLTQNSEDAALVLSVIAGNHEKDATTPNIEVPQYHKNLEQSVTRKKLGVVKEFLEAEGLDPQIKKSFEETIAKLKSEGAEIKEISLPLTEYAIPTYYLLVKAEASTNLARYDGIRFGKTEKADDLESLYKKTRSENLGEEVIRAIMMGTYTLSAGYFDAYYLKAAKVRTLIKEEYEKAFDELDAIVAPVSPFPAFQIGEKMDDPLAMYLADIYTVTANLAGICGLSVPTGLIDNLPTGVQILGKAFDEQNILSLGNAMEKIFPFEEIRAEKLL